MTLIQTKARLSVVAVYRWFAWMIDHWTRSAPLSFAAPGNARSVRLNSLAWQWIEG